MIMPITSKQWVPIYAIKLFLTDRDQYEWRIRNDRIDIDVDIVVDWQNVLRPSLVPCFLEEPP
jgi:hypothetical protein